MLLLMSDHNLLTSAQVTSIGSPRSTAVTDTGISLVVELLIYTKQISYKLIKLFYSAVNTVFQTKLIEKLFKNQIE